MGPETTWLGEVHRSMHLIGRRNFLSSLGLGVGAYLLSPIHKQLISEALGQPQSRRRLFLYLTQGGFAPASEDHEGYWPTPGADANAFTLGPAMTPLEPYRDELLFAESFYNPYNKHLHGNGFSTTTCISDLGNGEEKQPAGISFDRWVAKSIGANAPILSLNLCPHEVDDSDPQHTLSADGPKAIVPPMLNPVKAFAQIFGNAAPNDPNAGAAAEAKLARDKSVLDALAGDISKMSSRLAGAEKAKLDQYLTSVRDLEKQIGELAAAQTDCQALTPPPGNIYDQGRRSPREPVYKALVDIGVNAMACGLTQVVTFFAAEGGLDFMPLERPDGDVKFCGSHQMWHGKGSPNDHLQYYRFQFANMADVRKRLGGFGEGDGSIADSTLLLNFCVNGGPHHNGQDRYFAVFVGKLGGRLKSGRYLAFPRAQRSMADVFLTAGHALGVQGTSFGSPELKSALLPGVVA